MLQKRFLASISVTQPLSQPFSHAKVLILGAGTAGATIASQLSLNPLFKGGKDISIVDPSSTHYYQPLWTLVGGGVKKLSESSRPTTDILPSKTQWIQDSAKKVDPARNVVTLGSGLQVSYDFLVVATGFQLDWAKIPGLQESLGKNGVSSNYDVHSVEQTWENIKNFKGGNAIFTQPSTGIIII